jgi:hypothetical protein
LAITSWWLQSKLGERSCKHTGYDDGLELQFGSEGRW